jgi:CTP synthase
LDLGNYERFLDINLTSAHSVTTGKVFKSVFDKERKGDYLGQTVQMVPHVTDFIQEHIRETAKITVDGKNEPDVCVVEIGGTVGDHEGALYYEALSEFASKEQCCFVHVSLIPSIHGSELKTKPTQHSMKSIRALGISPDVLILRCDRMMNNEEIAKVGKFCKIPVENIIVNENVDTIYRVPQLFLKQNIVNIIKGVLKIEKYPRDIPDYEDYNNILKHFDTQKEKVTITIVGKYVGMQDTYLSLIRAIEHASFKSNVSIDVDWVDSELPNEELLKRVKASSGTIIPGGFGDRGIEGMITVANWCRYNNHPLLGICLGLQIMCIEMDRDINQHPYATSEEFDKEDSRIHTVVLSDVAQTQMGATMRLGSYRCKLERGSLVHKLYPVEYINERHRHRYEVSSRFVADLQNRTNNTIRFTGYDVRGRYPEILEHTSHKFYVGCQFHPELLSRHSSPHPLFTGLLEAITN